LNNRVVVAYSGTPAATAALRSLVGRGGADVVALTLDLGTGDDLQEVHERAIAAGAARAHVLDVREEFLRDYVLPALQDGRADGEDPMPASLAAPLIAKKLDDIARIERASAVVQGPPSDVHVNAAAASGADASSEADVEIAFHDGVPTTISGVPMPLAELFESLAIIAAQHGIRPPSRFQDAPAAVVLAAAYAALSGAEQSSPAGRANGIVRVKIAGGALRIDQHVAMPSTVRS